MTIITTRPVPVSCDALEEIGKSMDEDLWEEIFKAMDAAGEKNLIEEWTMKLGIAGEDGIVTPLAPGQLRIWAVVQVP